MKQEYEKLFKDKLEEDNNALLFNYTSIPAFELTEGDLLEFDFSKADIVLINSTCFDHVLM